MSLDERMARVETHIDSMSKTLERIADAMSKLAVVEVESRGLHARLTKAEADLSAIKAELPTLKLARYGAGEAVRYVLMAVLGGAVAAALAYMPK